MAVADIRTARDAIFARFKTVWDAQAPPVPRVIYQRVRDDKLGGQTEWAKIEVRHFTGNQRTLADDTGARGFARRGRVFVEIRVPTNVGGGRLDALAEVALSAFEQGNPADSVWFRDVRAVDVDEDGPWERTDVLAEFEWDQVR